MPRTIDKPPPNPARPDGCAPAGRTTVGVDTPETTSKLNGDELDRRTARSSQRRSRPVGALWNPAVANPAGEGLCDPTARHTADGFLKSGAAGGRSGMGHELTRPGAADSEAAQ